MLINVLLIYDKCQVIYSEISCPSSSACSMCSLATCANQRQGNAVNWLAASLYNRCLPKGSKTESRGGILIYALLRLDLQRSECSGTENPILCSNMSISSTPEPICSDKSAKSDPKRPQACPGSLKLSDHPWIHICDAQRLMPNYSGHRKD
jgi:hypothetical protein